MLDSPAVSALSIFFQQADFNFRGTARHFTLQYLTPSLEKIGNGLNRRTLHTQRSGNCVRKFTFYNYFLQRNPVNDNVDEAVVVLTAVGFHAQATTIKP